MAELMRLVQNSSGIEKFLIETQRQFPIDWERAARDMEIRRAIYGPGAFG